MFGESADWWRPVPLGIADAPARHGVSARRPSPSSRVLLRWHERQQAWLQIGGHGDPGERDPLAVALREGREETGLTDLEPWPDAALRHVVVVPVPANDREPAHEHADLRFVLATQRPEAARPERPTATLRWLSIDDALHLTSEENVRETVRRAGRPPRRNTEAAMVGQGARPKEWGA